MAIAFVDTEITGHCRSKLWHALALSAEYVEVKRVAVGRWHTSRSSV